MNLTEEQWATVLENQGLVGWTLDLMRVPQDLWDDAYQDGLLGLAEAVRRHDPEKGTLGTLAKWWIRKSVQHGRGQFEGINFRRDTKEGSAPTAWVAPIPMSSTVVATDDSLLPLADIIEDPADVASDALCAALVSSLRAECTDDVDAAALGFLVGLWTSQDAGHAVNVDPSTITYRARRLRGIAREAA